MNGKGRNIAPPKPQVFLNPRGFDALLERYNLKPNKVAQFLGVSEALISLWRSRQRPVSVDHRLKLLSIFECSFDQLFELVYPTPEIKRR